MDEVLWPFVRSLDVPHTVPATVMPSKRKDQKKKKSKKHPSSSGARGGGDVLETRRCEPSARVASSVNGASQSVTKRRCGQWLSAATGRTTVRRLVGSRTILALIFARAFGKGATRYC